jgi:hypothetical protein
MAGAAQWCMDQPAPAVDTWQAGLNAEYTDAAGLGVRLPLLLFAASILKSEVSLRKEAEATLREKATDLRAGYWPGVLTRFVLGRVSAEEALGSISLSETLGREHVLWWLRFYGHLLELDSGILTKAEFAALMRILTDTSQPSFSDLDYFLTVLWTEEFFIARHSARSD